MPPRPTTPDRRRETAGAALALTAVTTLGLGGTRDAAVPEGSPLATVVAGLSARDDRARHDAARALRGEREALVRSLTAAVRELREAPTPDRGFEGASHRVLEAAADWRVDDCAVDLARLVSFELDRTSFPAGAKYHPSVYFPAARALVALGNSATSRLVVQNLQGAEDDISRRLNAWVLFAIHGEELARAVLERAAASAPARPERLRLEAAARRVAEGDALLLDPGIPPDPSGEGLP